MYETINKPRWQNNTEDEQQSGQQQKITCGGNIHYQTMPKYSNNLDRRQLTCYFKIPYQEKDLGNPKEDHPE